MTCRAEANERNAVNLALEPGCHGLDHKPITMGLSTSAFVAIIGAAGVAPEKRCIPACLPCSLQDSGSNAEGGHAVMGIRAELRRRRAQTKGVSDDGTAEGKRHTDLEIFLTKRARAE